MANHKSAEKRARQNVKKRAHYRSRKSTVRTAIKKLYAAVEGQNKDESTTLLKKTQSLLAKLAKSSAMNKKTAARLTSRLTNQVNKVS